MYLSLSPRPTSYLALASYLSRSSMGMQDKKQEYGSEAVMAVWQYMITKITVADYLRSSESGRSPSVGG